MPSNSRVGCSRWKAPNSLSRVAPCRSRRRCRARSTGGRAVCDAAPNSIRAGARFDGELPGVAEQVLEHARASSRGSPSALHARLDATTRPSRAGVASPAAARRCRARERAQVDRPRGAARLARRARAPAGRRSAAPMRCAARATRCEVVAPASSSASAVVLEQRLAEAVDGAQRRAQVVRDRVAERLELAVDASRWRRAARAGSR